jgi:hypothetical protein
MRFCCEKDGDFFSCAKITQSLVFKIQCSKFDGASKNF